MPWDVIIMDESQALKNRNSRQSKAAKRMRHIGRRIALSGTPVDSGEIDIFSQMRFVDHTVLGENWTDFANEWCYQTGFMGREWRFNSKKKDQFTDILKPYIYRLTVKFLNLPPVKVYPIPVNLFGAQRRYYDQMEKEGVITVDGVTIASSLEATRRIKCEQITGGIVLDEKKKPHIVGQAKQRKLRYLIKKLDLPIVVFCKQREEIPLIRKILEERIKRVGELHGGIKDKNNNARTRMINDFREGRLDAIIAQVRTGSVAIDFTRSHELVLYSINDSFIDFEQLIFRLRGMNQTEQLNVWFLYAEDTVDEEKISLIQNKKLVAQGIVSPFVKEKT